MAIFFLGRKKKLKTGKKVINTSKAIFAKEVEKQFNKYDWNKWNKMKDSIDSLRLLSSWQ